MPILGDLPLIGPLFRSERSEITRREVIIVLTPYILPERQRINRTIPKSEDVFDTFGQKLFRDAYRLREDEVFDLAFITENRRLQSYKLLANTVIGRNFRLADHEPFSQFVGERIPGEHILVERMIYEIIKRLDLDERIADDRIIYFIAHEHAGYHVRFLEEFIAGHTETHDAQSFFTENPDTALYLTYHFQRQSMRPGTLASEPVPEIGLIDCDSRERWSELLWDLNQPDDQGRTRFTIVIHSPDDLQRLRRAIALKRVVQLNGDEPNLALRNFSVGTMLQMPDLMADEIHVLDADVARYFYLTEHYYPAATRRIEQAIDALDQALQRPEIQPYLEGLDYPPGP